MRLLPSLGSWERMIPAGWSLFSVLEAVRHGEIQKSRHQSYLRLYEELKPLKEWEQKK